MRRTSYRKVAERVLLGPLPEARKRRSHPAEKGARGTTSDDGGGLHRAAGACADDAERAGHISAQAAAAEDQVVADNQGERRMTHAGGRPQSRATAEGQGRTPASAPSSSTTRTSGSGDRSCRRCGRPIPGRRMKFCGDTCRMRAKRAEEVIRRRERDARIDGLVVEVERALAALKAGLASGS